MSAGPERTGPVPSSEPSRRRTDRGFDGDAAAAGPGSGSGSVGRLLVMSYLALAAIVATAGWVLTYNSDLELPVGSE